jgi:hypothetical protein
MIAKAARKISINVNAFRIGGGRRALHIRVPLEDASD